MLGGGGAIITDITIVNTAIHSVSRITDHALVLGQICIVEVEKFVILRGWKVLLHSRSVNIKSKAVAVI